MQRVSGCAAVRPLDAARRIHGERFSVISAHLLVCCVLVVGQSVQTETKIPAEDFIAKHAEDFWKNYAKHVREERTSLMQMAGDYCMGKDLPFPERPEYATQCKDTVLQVDGRSLPPRTECWDCPRVLLRYVATVLERPFYERGMKTYRSSLKSMLAASSTPTIAIVEPLDRHSEVIGTILESLRDLSAARRIRVLIYTNTNVLSSPLSFISYYKERSNVFGHFQVDDIDRFAAQALNADMVIVLSANMLWRRDFTSGERRWPLDHHREATLARIRSTCVAIAHDTSSYLVARHYCRTVFALSPIVTGDVVRREEIASVRRRQQSYFVPVFSTHAASTETAPLDGWMRLLVLGWGNPGKDEDDLAALIAHLERTNAPAVVTIVSKGTGASVSLKRRLSHHIGRRVQWFERCTVTELVRLVRPARFVLPMIGGPTSMYRRWRVTGSLSMALSYGVPLLADRSFLVTYGLEDAGLAYSSSVIEAFDAALVQSTEAHQALRASARRHASRAREEARQIIAGGGHFEKGK